MTPLPVRTTRRPARVLLDVVLRATAIVGGASVLTDLSGETDALAAGLSYFFDLVGLAFVIALLDGLFRRDRLRLYAGWAIAAPVVGLVEAALDLRRQLTGPGAYPGIEWVSAGGLVETYLMYTLLMAAPAAFAILLGVLIRPLTPAPGPIPSAPRT